VEEGKVKSMLAALAWSSWVPRIVLAIWASSISSSEMLAPWVGVGELGGQGPVFVDISAQGSSRASSPV